MRRREREIWSKHKETRTGREMMMMMVVVVVVVVVNAACSAYSDELS